jgi:co-chaperonin GroES (HSP10)
MEPVKNVFRVGTVEFEALGDRVIVLEDQFVSGYECKACQGHGWVPCTECVEGKSKLNPNIQCRVCSGTQKAPCEKCSGKGALLVIPEKSERRPTTGTIVSVGEGCKVMQKDSKVMYGSFAGHVVTLGEIVLRVLHESEILCRVSGHLEYRAAAAE